MAFLVLDWDDADVEDLEGNLLRCQSMPIVLNPPWLLRKHSLQYTKDFSQDGIGQNPQTFN